jgi:HAMP domain-containing protein
VRIPLPLPLKLMMSYLIVAGFITLPAFFFLRSALTGSLEASEERTLLARAESLRQRLADVKDADLDHSVRSYAELLGLRITVVDRSGRVLTDSEVPVEKIPEMENHATRPEIVSAFATGSGTAVRLSVSIGQELVYVAVPIDLSGRAVVRVAGPRSKIYAAVNDAFVALRVGVGIGISTALLLSLIAALYVSSPLRRMRDVAKAYAEARWTEVKPIRTGDELEDLSTGLVELGRQLRKQLVAAGAPESLMIQALDVLPPAGLFSPELEPCYLNAGFRRSVGWVADAESRAEAQARGVLGKLDPKASGSIAIDLGDPGKPVAARALPLVTASGPPYWLVLVPDRPSELFHARALAAARELEDLIGAVSGDMRWKGRPAGRHLDTIALALAAASPDHAVDPVATRRLVVSCVEQVNAELGAARVTVRGEIPEEPVANASAAARCMRAVARVAAGAFEDARPVFVSARLDGAHAVIEFDVRIESLVRDDALVQSALAAAGAELAHSDDGMSLRLPRV